MEISSPEKSYPLEETAESESTAVTSESMEVDGSNESAANVSIAAETKEPEEETGPEKIELPALPELEEILSELTPAELLAKFQKKPPFLFVAPTKVRSSKCTSFLLNELKSGSHVPRYRSFVE